MKKSHKKNYSTATHFMTRNDQEVPTTAEKPHKETITMDDLYRRSTQFRLWSFTADELRKRRMATNEQGRNSGTQKFRAALQKAKEAHPQVFADHAQELSEEVLLETITLEEELKYLNFYSKNIIQAANFFKMATQVKATAISFFKKFYLLNSVMEYHPKFVLYTCLFLAAKSENYFISIESFCRGLQKTEPKDILDLEFTILQALRFTLLVHHPFRPLYGFFLDFQQVLIHSNGGSDVTIDQIGRLYDEAKKWLNEHGLLSDVAYLFTPPQIALAAMYDCDKRITEKYLKRKFRRDPTEGESAEQAEQDSVDQYHKIVRTIQKCVEQGMKIEESSREESTKIDRKCFFIINPEKLINKRIKKLTAQEG